MQHVVNAFGIEIRDSGGAVLSDEHVDNRDTEKEDHGSDRCLELRSDF